MPILKRRPHESAACVCGHPFADHISKAPHRCIEDHAFKAGHRCSCTAFQAPIGTMPDAISFVERDTTLTGGADRELNRVLSAIPRGANDFS